MPASRVKSLGTSNSSAQVASHTHTFTGSVPAGNMVTMQVVHHTSQATVSYSDTQGNTWQTDAAVTNGTSHTIYTISSIITNPLTSSDSFTMTSSATRFWGMVANEYASVASSGRVDKFNTATSSSNTNDPDVTLATATTQADELLVVGVGTSGAYVYTADPNYTHTGAAATPTTIRSIDTEFRTINATGTHRGGGTFNATEVWTCTLVAYKAAVAAGTQFNQAVGGTLSFAGTISRGIFKRVLGTLGLGGSLNAARQAVQFLKSVGGSLTMTGGVSKRTLRSVAGTLGLSGTIGTIKTKVILLGGALGFSGTLSRQPRKVTGGSLALAGTLTRRASKNLAGTLTASGSVVKQTAKRMLGSLSFAGLGSGVKNIGPQVFYAAVGGVLQFSGSVSKSSRKRLSGTLTSVGTLTREIRKRLSGSLSWAGTLASLKTLAPVVYQQTVGGTLAFAGSVRKQTHKRLAGSLTFAGSLARQLVGYVVTWPAGLVRAALERLSWAASLESIAVTATLEPMTYSATLETDTWTDATLTSI